MSVGTSSESTIADTVRELRTATTFDAEILGQGAKEFLEEAAKLDRYADEARDRGDAVGEEDWRALAERTRARAARLESLIA